VSGEDTRHLPRFTCQRTVAALGRATTQASYHGDARAVNLFPAAFFFPPLVEMSGLEPPTSALQRPRSPS
jgi:hypothetical protein